MSVPIGDASNGLCGGMAFAARDYFEAGHPPPADTEPPSEDALFEYLVDRLFDSFGLPLGPTRYLEAHESRAPRRRVRVEPPGDRAAGARLADDPAGMAGDPDLVLVVVGTISVLAAVLSSLQTFLRYATRAEGHRIAALRYETLRRDMATTLALPREARGEPDKDLNSVRQRMDRYAKESPTIGERQWEKISADFGLSTVPPDPSRRAEPVMLPAEPNPRAQAVDAET